MKTEFLDTIAVCDLKVGRCRHVLEFMKVCEYLMSMSFLDLGPSSVTYENLKLAFLRQLGHF